MDKPLSDKQFIRKASAVKVIADAFLNAYEDHIRATYKDAGTALDQFKSGEMRPNVALSFVKEVVAKHLLQTNIARAEESIRKQHQKKTPSKSNVTGSGKFACIITIKVTNERTRECEEAVFVDHNGHDTFLCDTYQAALRLVDRKQADMPDALYSVISHELTPGRFLKTTIMRGDSIARFFRQPKGPVTKGKPMSASLKNYMHCHNDTCSFSRG